MTEGVVTTEAIRCAKLQSNHHYQQTNTQFLTGQRPFLSPNQRCQSTEGFFQIAPCSWKIPLYRWSHPSLRRKGRSHRKH